MQNSELPNNFEAEQGVLATILYMPKTMSDVADRLKPQDFYKASYQHEELFKAMLQLYHQDKQIGTATMVEQLKRNDITEIRDRPVSDYLDFLWRIGLEQGPTIFEDAKLVENAALLRRQYLFLSQASQVLSGERDGMKALAKLQGLLSSINEEVDHTDLRPMSEILSAFLEDLDVRNKEYGKVTGVATGLDDLDALLGGLQRSELIVLGGLPGEGKTSLMLNFIYHLILHSKLSSAVFSLEMNAVDLARRLVSMDTKIDSQILRNRTLKDKHWEHVVKSTTETLVNDHVFIDDSGDLTISSMRTKLDRFKARHGLDLVVVDYLQMIQGETEEENSRYHENEVAQLTKISKGLKRLAKHYNVPVLALASLNRAGASRGDKRPQLSDLRGSGSIEFDADVVMFVMKSQEREGYSLVAVEKHRNGPRGDVNLRFNPKLTRFYNDGSIEDMEPEEDDLAS